MKKCKKILSMALAFLLLLNVFPLTAHAAKLKITTQPKTSYTAYGKTAKATVKAKGSGLKYTWYVKNVGDKKYSKSSVNKPTYSVKMTDTTKDCKVYCVVKDKKGKSVKSKTVTLKMKVSITTQPKNASVKKGDTAKVTLKAKGDGLKYTWYTKKSGEKSYSKTKVTKATYSVKMDKKIAGSSVYCVVKDKYGNSVKSKIVTLGMKKEEPLTITKQPDDTSASANFDQVGFGIIVTGGTAPYTYTLQYNSDKINRWMDLRDDDVEVLKIGSMTELVFAVSFSDDYRYRIVVTDAAGNGVISNVVHVERLTEPLTIIEQPQCTTAMEGDQVGFGIVVSGGTEPYTYELICCSESVGRWKRMRDVEVLTVGLMTELVFEVRFDMDYQYRIVVTDAAGEFIESEIVWVEQEESEETEPLAIVWQTTDLDANVGDEIEFGVGISGGTSPYTYQWQYTKNNLDEWLDIEDSDTSDWTVFVDNAQFDEDYHYRCIITDAEGEQIISVPMDLVELLPAFVITTQPQNDTAQVGDMVTFSVVVEGGKEPYTYRWEYMCDEFNWDLMGPTWAIGSDTATVSFGVYESEFIYHYKYRCKITDHHGNVLYTDEVWVEEL